MMSDIQYYTQSTDLQQLIDWDAIMPLERFAGGHDEQMQKLFKGAKVLSHWNEGNWQGMVATAVELPDGRCLLYNDYYGSCSGCDSWENASDEGVRKLCIDLANGAYIFPSSQEAKAWLEDVAGGRIEPDSYEWRIGATGDNCAQHLLENWE